MNLTISIGIDSQDRSFWCLRSSTIEYFFGQCFRLMTIVRIVFPDDKSISFFCPTPDRRIQLVISSEFDKVKVHLVDGLNLHVDSEKSCLSVSSRQAEDSSKRDVIISRSLLPTILRRAPLSSTGMCEVSSVEMWMRLRRIIIVVHSLYTHSHTQNTSSEREQKLSSLLLRLVC